MALHDPALDSHDMSQSPNPNPPRKNWFRRNLLWVLPSGCLLFVLFGLGCIALFIHFVFTALKSSEPYETALAAATQNPAVIQALGEPVEAAYLITGSVNLENDNGTADLAIPISGPQASAIIYVEAEKTSGHWTYQRLAVELDETRQRIPLTPPTP